MECIILSGGFGTRLGDISTHTPKGLLKVQGTPILNLVLESLRDHGFTKIILALGHLSDQIMDHFGSSFRDMQIVYSVEKEPLGTGGAVLEAMKLVENDFVFVINGDSLQEINYQEMLGAYRKNPGLPLLASRRVADTARYGSILAEGDTVIEFAEKQKAGPGMINAGCYLLPVDIFDGTEPTKAFSLEKDFLPKAVTVRTFKIFELKSNFIDIGTLESLHSAQGFESR
jgi:D-glycero-alpha-D-manno-heptose 1-phosphate guanylyltransferase